jgi:hypothetical protein
MAKYPRRNSKVKRSDYIKPSFKVKVKTAAIVNMGSASVY